MCTLICSSQSRFLPAVRGVYERVLYHQGHACAGTACVTDREPIIVLGRRYVVRTDAATSARLLWTELAIIAGRVDFSVTPIMRQSCMFRSVQRSIRHAEQ